MSFETYQCKHCGLKVRDRHPHYDEECRFSPSGNHEWNYIGHGENDLKWKESYIGKLWKSKIGKILIMGFIAYILYKALA